MSTQPHPSAPPARGPQKTLVEDDGPDSTALPAQRDRAVLTVLTGTRAGQLVPVDGRRVVIGRAAEADLVFPDESLSWQHACIRTIGDEMFVQDLGSTNGTYLNGEKVPYMAKLVDGDRIGLGSKVVLRVTLQDALEAQVMQRLYDQIMRDPLTNAYNRHAFEERLSSEISYTRRHGDPLTLIMFDLDCFKRINDEKGHAAGDAVLREVIGTLLTEVREEDMVARYGGEEFVVLARGIGTSHGISFAERMRRIIARTPALHDGELLHVTASFGVASTDAGAEGREGLLTAADEALYQAKDEGRNKVVAWEESMPSTVPSGGRADAC